MAENHTLENSRLLANRVAIGLLKAWLSDFSATPIPLMCCRLYGEVWSVMLPPGEHKTFSLSGNRVTLIHGHPGGAYSVVEWVSEPGISGSPLHIHTTTDEAFYVVDGTFCFLAGERTFQGGAGASVFAPKGLEHTYWNEGNTPSKMLITISPPGFERYFEGLVEGLQRRSKVLNRTRSHAGFPAFASSNASTVSRFDRYDERCRKPHVRVETPPVNEPTPTGTV